MQVTSQRVFALGACLGKGGFGEVYRATMTSGQGIAREVAVKLLRADVDLGDDAVRRLRDEGRLLARLDHPALLVVHDLVELGGRVALVTEFVDGEDLSSCIRAGMPTRAVLQAVGQAADALHAAWTAPFGPNGGPMRLAHRDIKPGNLRISRHGTLKVLDFGIARSDEVTREARTATDLIVGSPAYMAPERFLDTDVRSASDVFALGCVLYEALVGERVFAGVSAMVMSTMALDRGRYDRFMAERLQLDELDDDVAALVRECLAFAPDARPTCAALARRCEALADRIGGQSLLRWTRDREWPTGAVVRGSLDGAVLTEGSLEIPKTPSATRSRGWLWLGGGAVAGGLALVGALVLFAGAAWVWQSGLLSADAVEIPVPVDVPEPAPAPEPETVAAPDPVVDPAPDPVPVAVPAPVAAPVAAPVRVPAPAPAPAPVVVPAPRAEPVATGRVRLRGDHGFVALARGGEVVPLALDGVTEVPAGTWTTRSTNSAVARLAEVTVNVVEGGVVGLRCSASIGSCAVEP